MSDDDIPILRDAVARRASESLSEAQLDDVADRLIAATRQLVDELLEGALREAEDVLRIRLAERLNDELPGRIDNVLRDRSGGNAD